MTNSYMQLVISCNNNKTFTGHPAGARYHIGISYFISERQHALTLQTPSCTLRVGTDRACAIDALAETDILLSI